MGNHLISRATVSFSEGLCSINWLVGWLG